MNKTELIEEYYLKAVEGIKEEWFNSTDGKWYKHIMEQSDKEKITYLVVVLHNQVFNGGFHQYFANGYGQFAKETINALNTIGASKKAELLKRAIQIVNSENLPDEKFRADLLNKKLKLLFNSDDLYLPLEELDDIYYSEEDTIDFLSDYLQT